MRDLTSGDIYKGILNFTWPLLVSQVLQQMYHVVDSVIVGHVVGKEALAAVGASFPVMFALISFMIGVVSGTTILISQYYGAGNLKSVKKATDTLYIAVAIISIILSVISITFSTQIFRMMSLPENIIPSAVLFFNINMGGMLLLFGFNATNAVLRGLGDSRTPMWFVIISVSINIILNFIFVLGFHWGVGGVAAATVISQGVGLAISLTYLNRHHAIFSLRLNRIEFDREILRKSLKIGLPSGIQQVAVALSILFLVSLVNTFGTNVIAAYTVGSRIGSFTGMVAMVFGMSVATFTAQNMGAGKTDRVKKGLMATMVMGVSVTLVLSLLTIIFPEFLIQLFIRDENVVAAGTNYLIICGLFNVFFAIMCIVNGLISGSGDTFTPMLISLLVLYFIRIPVAYFFAPYYHELAVWWSFPASWVLASILSTSYYLSGRWKKKSQNHKPSPDIAAPTEIEIS